MVKTQIETYLRIKPTSNSQIDYSIKENFIDIRIPEDQRKGYVNNLKKSYDFKFTGLFERDSTQEIIYNSIGHKVIKNSLQGYNNTVFCYGQTGSGKTYTMCGSKIWADRGLIPRIILELFKQIKQAKEYSYDIYISYLEIYNENAFDLLDRNHSEIEIENWKKIIVYEDNYNNIILKNLSLIKVENEHQALDLLMTGNFIRHVSSTPMNQASSRSHSIFSILIEGRDTNTDITRVSKINLVDLAGSERIKLTGNDRSLITETKYINLSLSFLEQVILALNEKSNKGNRSHIPYRNSLMTTILKDSLGGNCKTILIATISSDIDCLDETISTMRFAQRCAKVENEISVNEHMDLNILVNKLQNENNLLRSKLETLSNNLDNEELDQFEMDECKVIINDYINDNSEGKKLKAKNSKQLFYIIDFLLDYINNRENIFKEKINEIDQQKKELIESNEEMENKLKFIENVIENNKLENFFPNLFQTESLKTFQSSNNQVYSKTIISNKSKNNNSIK